MCNTIISRGRLEKKLLQEVIKVKTNYKTNILYFISSRRIPENSFQEVSMNALKQHGVVVNRFDNQAIATEFIKRNKVGDLLSVFGVKPGKDVSGLRKYLGPKKEAIAAILIFGQETKELRDGVYDSLIKSYLAKYEKVSLGQNLLKAY